MQPGGFLGEDGFKSEMLNSKMVEKGRSQETELPPEGKGGNEAKESKAVTDGPGAPVPGP